MQAGLQKTSSEKIKLGSVTLPQLSTQFPVPAYDRENLKAGILHMSVGGFHRSHQAVYLDMFLNKNPSDWMIEGVGLMPQDKDNLNKLAEQGGLYAVLERAPDSDQVRIVGSMKNVLHAPSDPAAIINRIASPEIKILSLTITEKGYYYDDKRNLNANHPAIQNDIVLPENPQTAYGYLVKGLQKRRADNVGPVTIMCCDNLPGNGHITEHLLLQFTKLADPSLVEWINANVSFPNAMVDRITPVTTDKIRDILADDFGIDDAWPVVCEDYLQWIIEDKFIAGRPALENVGVQIVKDVEPYEKMKVRLLNGSHSALSYVSYLLGHREVDKAMADPLVSKFVRAYMDECITPSVPDVPGIDLDQYKDKLISRFANPSISDQVQRLAEDGSQKIRNAIVPPLEFQLEQGASIKWIALALAGWFRYLNGTDEKGAAIEIKDPMAAKLSSSAQVDGKDAIGLLKFDEIFGPALVGDKRLVDEINNYLEQIYTNGMRKTLEAALQS